MRNWCVSILILMLSAITTITVSAHHIGSHGNMVSNDSPHSASPHHLDKNTHSFSINPVFNTMNTITQQLKIARVGDSCWLQMPLVQWSRTIPSQHRLVIRPVLRSASDSIAFPAQVVYGKWASYHALRQGHHAEEGDDHILMRRSKSMADSLTYYVKSLPWQGWMSNCALVIQYTEMDGCENIVNYGEQRIFDSYDIPAVVTTQTVPTTAAVAVAPPTTTKTRITTKVRRRLGSAYLNFPSGSTKILPDFGNNQNELDKICDAINKTKSDKSAILNHISLKGYASPEGSYASNERLARGRSYALRQYIIDHCGLSDSIVSADYEAEDWVGLRRYVESSSLPEKDALLTVIDRDGDPDRKLKQIATRYPKAYRFLADSIFPLLRHTDYRIDFLETFNEADTVVVLQQQPQPQQQSIVTTTVTQVSKPAETIKAADDWNPVRTSRTFEAYRPLLAVKTNLLYDVLVAPNIELETMLGRSARWSIMAEYCNPWWRWSKLDHSYEIQEGGLEVRYWFSPRCYKSRPWLSGHFFGVYGAVAKYDMEYDQTGDQGDVFSAGLSYGYSWPIASHWNLEFNIAAGVVAGERRHYHAEFESTHLIYKYTKNLLYVGPTKLKFSLVYIIGKKSKKGGDAWAR